MGPNGIIEIRWNHVNTKNFLISGQCKSLETLGSFTVIKATLKSLQQSKECSNLYGLRPPQKTLLISILNISFQTLNQFMSSLRCFVKGHNRYMLWWPDDTRWCLRTRPTPSMPCAPTYWQSTTKVLNTTFGSFNLTCYCKLEGSENFANHILDVPGSFCFILPP